MAGATHGWLKVAGGCDVGVVGHYQTHLYLHEVLRLPLAVSRELARHSGHLYLDGVESSRAAVLAAHPGFRGYRGLSGLFINGVTTLSPAVAATVATHTAGTLSLNGLTEIAPNVARELVRHPLLSLDGLGRISDDVAATLATHSGASLSVRRLEVASPRAIACLRENPTIDLGCRQASAGICQSRHGTQELVAMINRIAEAGEEALRRGGQWR